MPGTGCLNDVTLPNPAIGKLSHSLPARWVVLVLILAPIAAAAQSLITVSPQQCVWRAGDDPEWAAQDLDESGWAPFSGWKFNPSEPRFWIRCSLDPAAFAGLEHPGLQVNMLAAYEAFLNGVSVARSGNLLSGGFSTDSIRTYPIPPTLLRVVEARNAAGELFGFERTRAISTESAAKVVQAAQAFGQEDDITVLTLTFAQVAVAHA